MPSSSPVTRRDQAVQKWKKRAAAALRKMEFDKRLVGITEKVLKQVFGEEATGSILKHLKKNYGLKLEQIPDKPEVFSRGLESYLNSGATVVERIILERLATNSRIKLDRMKTRTFRNNLNELRLTYDT